MEVLPPVEWTAIVSAERDPDPHGDVSVGIRRGAFSAMWRTEAPELKWSPAWERGNGWVSARGHLWATNLIHAPFADGAPDPASALATRSAGLDVGVVGYGPGGTWAGLRANVDGYLFAPYETTTISTPAPRVVSSADVMAGWWQPGIEALLRAGTDVQGGDEVGVVVGPHVAAELHWAPAWTVAPRVEVWAGAAGEQDFVTRTRLGGLTPWAVPLAGAAWGEFWVEDYAVARLGPSVGGKGWRLGPFADLATFDGETAAGFGAQGRVWRGRAFVEAAGGYAPWIERQAGFSRAALWLSLGMDWGHGWTPSDDRPSGPHGAVWPR